MSKNILILSGSPRLYGNSDLLCNEFLKGAKEGMEIVIKIFPTLVGLFVAIGLLRYSGVLDFIIKLIYPIVKFIGIPKEIMPLAILRPISRKCINCSWK